MAFMLKVEESTMHLIFVGWMVFLETIFTHINLEIIDCTEFQIQHVSNLDLNSLMFSNYKNTITGKALIGIAPHGMGLFFQ